MTTPKQLLKQLDFRKLKKLRVSKGISAYRVAKDTGISNEHVRAIEQGTTPNPSVGILMSIAEFHGMSVGELLAYCAKK